MVKEFPYMLENIRPDDSFLEIARNRQKSPMGGICFCGIGGSAIVNEICYRYFINQSQIPFLLKRDSILPSFIDSSWIVIAVSYSGETKETLSMFNEAKKRDCEIFSITTGGELEKASKDMPIQKIPSGYKPRAAFPAIFACVFPLTETLLGLDQTNLQSTARDLIHYSSRWYSLNTSPSVIASMLRERIPWFFGWNYLTPVAYRAKCQISENAKSIAMFSELPESNHNDIEGIFNCQKYPVLPIFLRSMNEGPDVAHEIDTTIEIFIEHKCLPLTIDIGFTTIIHEILGLTYFFDLVSVHLADFLKVDALNDERIRKIKRSYQMK